KGIQFIPENIILDFMALRHVAFVLSAVFIVGSLILTVRPGLNFGVDFTGGTVIAVKAPALPDITALRSDLNELGLGTISIQEFGDPSNLLIRMQQQDGDSEAQQLAIGDVRRALDDIYAEVGEVDYRRMEFVGPQVGV